MRVESRRARALNIIITTQTNGYDKKLNLNLLDLIHFFFCSLLHTPRELVSFALEKESSLRGVCALSNVDRCVSVGRNKRV